MEHYEICVTCVFNRHVFIFFCNNTANLSTYFKIQQTCVINSDRLVNVTMQYLIFTDHCVCVLGLNKSVIYTGVMLYTALVTFCFVSSILNIPFMISFFYQTHCVLDCTMITKISCH